MRGFLSRPQGSQSVGESMDVVSLTAYDALTSTTCGEYQRRFRFPNLSLDGSTMQRLYSVKKSPRNSKLEKR